MFLLLRDLNIKIITIFGKSTLIVDEIIEYNKVNNFIIVIIMIDINNFIYSFMYRSIY